MKLTPPIVVALLSIAGAHACAQRAIESSRAPGMRFICMTHPPSFARPRTSSPRSARDREFPNGSMAGARRHLTVETAEHAERMLAVPWRWATNVA
jgi:hypothetical protein